MQAQCGAGTVDQHAGQHVDTQRAGQRIEAQRVVRRLGQPQQIAAALHVIDQGLHRAGRQRHRGAGQHHQIGVLGHRVDLAEVQRHRAHAATFQLRHEGAHVRIRLAVGAPLAVAGDEGHHAVAAADQALQRVGEAALGELVQPLLALAVADDQRAIHGDAQLAHRGRVLLRIDKAQLQVGLHCLVALQEAGHGLAQVALRAGVAGDFHRAIQPCQHRAALRRQAGATAGGPVRDVGEARAEKTQRSGCQ